jgi:transcriptional regulator with XRE-family HTH domain
MAHQLGVAFSTLNRWERGHSAPSGLALMAIEATRASFAPEFDPRADDSGEAPDPEPVPKAPRTKRKRSKKKVKKKRSRKARKQKSG